ALQSMPPTTRPPRPTLFPYTPPFRSHPGRADEDRHDHGGEEGCTRDHQPGEDLGHQADLRHGLLHGHIALFGHAAVAVLHAIFRSEEHTSELQSREKLVCRLLLE